MPGDMRSGEATYTVGSAHLTQSCPELRRRNRGLAKIQWDPRSKQSLSTSGLRPSRNVIHEDEMEDERKSRASLMQMYR